MKTHENSSPISILRIIRIHEHRSVKVVPAKNSTFPSGRTRRKFCFPPTTGETDLGFNFSPQKILIFFNSAIRLMIYKKRVNLHIFTILLDLPKPKVQLSNSIGCLSLSYYFLPLCLLPV